MNRSDIEMAIVKHLLERAKEFGWVCTKVDNGDGYELVHDDEYDGTNHVILLPSEH